MNFFSRLANIFRGFFSQVIGGVERDNPSIVYENAINGMLTKYNNAKNAVAAILANRNKAEKRLKTAEDELTQVNADLDAAIATDADDLAEILIQKKDELEKSVATAKADLESLSEQAESNKQMLLQFQAELNNLKRERDENIARHATAQAQIQVQDQLSGLSVESEIQALQGVRDGIENTVAKAQLNRELANNDIDNRLAVLRKSAGATSAKARVAALKAARQEGANKTL